MVCAIPVDSGNYNSNGSFWRVGETMKGGSCCSHRTLRPVGKRSARKNWLRQARNFSIKIQYYIWQINLRMVDINALQNRKFSYII